MDIQPEIATSPIGMHYHVCESCGEIFTAETTDTPYPDGTVEYVGYDTSTPLWCGCDGSVGREDKMCQDCTELLSDNYHDDLDYETHFADPGGTSALRAEEGVRNGLCTSCRGKVDHEDAYCRHCGGVLNQRNLPCKSCGRENMLTPKDRALNYICDTCADRNERDCD